MAEIHLTMGFTDYDHVRDLFTGRVKPEGIALTCLRMEVEESFMRFLRHQEWDVSEMSLAMGSAAVARGEAPFVLIPVFPSRVFRLSGIYVRADGPVKEAQDLAGKRIGVPQWAQTATVFIRGWLTDFVGVPLEDVAWFQMGRRSAGRIDSSAVRPRDGVRLTDIESGSLADMLVEGEIDALFCATPPRLFDQGDPRIVRLFPDYPEVERRYFAQTGIFPIMHTVAIRRRSYESNPWIARNMFEAFERAKAFSVERMQDVGVSQIPLPWTPETFARVRATLFGEGEYWPYGIARNRPTLEAFLGFCFDQGVTPRRLAPEELFCAEALEPLKLLSV